jgi:predicted glycosyltransferase
MTIKELKAVLNAFPEDTKVFMSSDEELNNIFEGFEVSGIEMEKSNGVGTYDAVIMYPLSGSEVNN